jgi:hypothetical protein
MEAAGGVAVSYWSVMVAGAFDRCDEHRPQSRDEMRIAAVELRQRGLTPADIAAALRLSEGAIRELLEVSE